MIEGAITVSCTEVRGQRRETVQRTVIEETPLAVYVNGRELATLMCTPIAVDDLVMGFLMGEGVIARPEEVVLLRVCLDEGLVNVRLVSPEVALPERRILTSGCSGGVTFDHLSQQHPALNSALRIPSSRIVELMDLMQRVLIPVPVREKNFKGCRRIKVPIQHHLNGDLVSLEVPALLFQ